jgi:hypothetical protein
MDCITGLCRDGFVASQRIDAVRGKFHLHDLIQFGKELLEMGMQP